MGRVAFTLCLCLVACQPPDVFVPRATRVVFEPGGRDFWSAPLPSELRRQADGTFNLDRWPGMRSQLVTTWLTAIDARVDGWGVNAGAFFPLSGAIDAATLPSPEASLRDDASVFFVDVTQGSPDYGRRFPLEVGFTVEPAPFRPANLLAVVPVAGFTRRAKTTYAVVVTDRVKDASGQPLDRSEAFHAAFETTKDANPQATQALEPLRAFLDAKRLDRRRVVGATVFTTIDPMAALTRLSRWVETLPTPTLEEPFSLLERAPRFDLYVARYRVPHVQSGPKPGRGRIVWAADGETPVQQGTQSVRLSLSVPKTPMPPGGWPVMLYLHGSGGEYREGMDRGPLAPTTTRDKQGEPPLNTGPADWLAAKGVAVMGFDFPLHGDRESPPDTTGRMLYDVFGDVDSSVDNMQVSAMEVQHLTRLLATGVTAQTAGGVARVDLTRLTAMGHSMGSTIGIPVASVDPRIQAYVFSGAGALLLEIATSTTYPVRLQELVSQLLGFEGTQLIDRAHPLLHAFQSLWDFTDPSAKARHVAREPLPGKQAHAAFLPQGVIDGYFHPWAQTAVAVQLGVTQAGEVFDPTSTDALALAGLPVRAAFPIGGNVNGVTVGGSQSQTPFDLGHYVVFDREDVQHQVECFLGGVGTPSGPRVVAPAPRTTPCH
ncbi:MAG: hypothetical protein JNJ54_16865 [Myxococcaceae bacterium]|nr:hypothetical protein [Myxococcaceae bacterium]